MIKGRSIIILGLTILVPLQALGADPTVVGAWSKPFVIGGTNWTLPTEHNPMHGLVLPSGQVLLWRFGFYPVLYHPHRHTFERIPPPPVAERLIGCSAHILLPDGRIIIAGGTTSAAHGTHSGHPHVFFFDTNVDHRRQSPWTIGPDMPGNGRWYPGAALLADGRVLVTSGYVRAGLINENGVIFDPIRNRWSLAPLPFSWISPNYPFLFNLPRQQLLNAGPSRGPLYVYDYAFFKQLSVPPHLTTGRHGGSTTVFLKNNQLMLILIGGGLERTPHRDTEYGYLSESPRWQMGPPMHYRRYHPIALTLPTGEVLVIGGDAFHEHETGEERPVLVPEQLDPQHMNRGWQMLAPHQIPRGAHAMALLLQDGSVLVLGGDTPEHLPQPSGNKAEIYYPPYFFKGPRPQMINPPRDLPRHHPVSIQYAVPGAPCGLNHGTIQSAVLIPLPSMTHGYTFVKGYFPLRLHHQQSCLTPPAKLFLAPTTPLKTVFPDVPFGRIQVELTVDPAMAPPGYYYLFLVNRNRVPSVASIVRIHP